jgi:lysophospholipase L1-like esterase
MKNAFNDKLRNLDGVEGCIDFESALRDKANPKAFAVGFDSGDHLHPSEAAYEVMATVAYKALSGGKA